MVNHNTILFSRIIHYQTLCIMIAVINFGDLIFVDEKLLTKTAKFTFLENLNIVGFFAIVELMNRRSKELKKAENTLTSLLKPMACSESLTSLSWSA